MEGVSFKSISATKRTWLEWPFSECEVMGAINSLCYDKAPGPDGFPMKFYKEFWHEVGKDVMNALEDFHRKDSLCRSLNTLFISLIQKK